MCHHTHKKIREQLQESVFLFHNVGPGDGTQAWQQAPLSNLMGPRNYLMEYKLTECIIHPYLCVCVYTHVRTHARFLIQ